MKQCKRLAALLLCLVLLATMIPSASAYTAGDNVNVYLDLTALLSLPEHNLLAFPWMATRYCSSAENGNTLTTSGEWIYCIDYYNKAQQGVVTSGTTMLEDTPYWRNLSLLARRGITYALIYGCPSYSNEFFGYAATQLIIWEYQTGARSYATQSCGMFATTLASSSRLKANYDGILAQIALHEKAPSFNQQKITLNGYGRANGVTITDANGTFRNDQWSISASAAKSGVVVEQTGDNLFIYATENLSPNKPVNIGLQRKLLVSTGNALCVMSAAQHAVLGTPPDPLAVSLSVQVNATGSLKIKKTSEDGVVAGITFRVTGNSYDQTATTDANGELLLEKLLPGTYTVTEQDAPDRYAPQQPQTVTVTANATAEVRFANTLRRGTIKGYKVNRENGETISGALFGLFLADEASFSEKNALLTAESGEDGVFTFENVLYGNYIVHELRPAAGYLENETVYPVTVDEDGGVVEITVVNNLIPEIGTTASIDGEKEVCATEGFTLTDTVEYKHLVPGKEYTVKGILMDRATGEPFLQNGEQITSEVTFVPVAPSGSVEVLFTFDAKLIKTDTNIVVFEGLYSDSKKLTVHADIEDEAQTVTVIVPEIKTQASTDGKKETTIGGEITIEDTVSYHNLTPGKEYVVKGTLMNKTTGKPVTVNDEPVVAETAFTPESRDGEVKVTLTFNSYVITETTDMVVFESLYREDVEIAVHADIEDEGQTVTVYVPEIKTTASIDGKKEITTAGKVTIEDVVSYTNLIPGTEYTIRGTLMNKATGEVFTVNGETITAEVKFTSENRNGEVKVTFTFDAHNLTTSTKLVVFESLYRENVEITTHKDIEDKDQTVTITPPPDVPQTGDTSSLGVWIGLGGVAALGALMIAIADKKRRATK